MNARPWDRYPQATDRERRAAWRRQRRWDTWEPIKGFVVAVVCGVVMLALPVWISRL